MTVRRPRFVVVSDELHECAYLPDRQARTPLRLAMSEVTEEAFDSLLEEGDRRAGMFLYRTACPTCDACEPLRIPVKRFLPTKSQRRVWRRNEADVHVELGPPIADEERVSLYNRHRNERGLAREDADVSVEDYEQHYVRSCVATCEVQYRVAGKLVALSILDIGGVAASSVYHCFDPAEEKRSLGVYSVLKEIELMGKMSMEWYYLGLYVGDCRNLSYKATYFPHQRRSKGVWREFASSDDE